MKRTLEEWMVTNVAPSSKAVEDGSWRLKKLGKLMAGRPISQQRPAKPRNPANDKTNKQSAKRLRGHESAPEDDIEDPTWEPFTVHADGKFVPLPGETKVPNPTALGGKNGKENLLDYVSPGPSEDTSKQRNKTLGLSKQVLRLPNTKPLLWQGTGNCIKKRFVAPRLLQTSAAKNFGKQAEVSKHMESVGNGDVIQIGGKQTNTHGAAVSGVPSNPSYTSNKGHFHQEMKKVLQVPDHARTKTAFCGGGQYPGQRVVASHQLTKPLNAGAATGRVASIPHNDVSTKGSLHQEVRQNLQLPVERSCDQQQHTGRIAPLQHLNHPSFDQRGPEDVRNVGGPIFQTASGRPVQVSTAGIARAQALLGDDSDAGLGGEASSERKSLNQQFSAVGEEQAASQTQCWKQQFGGVVKDQTASQLKSWNQQLSAVGKVQAASRMQCWKQQGTGMGNDQAASQLQSWNHQFSAVHKEQAADAGSRTGVRGFKPPSRAVSVPSRDAVQPSNCVRESSFPIPGAASTSMSMFRTAKGQAVSISPSAMQKAMSLLGEGGSDGMF